MGRHARTLEMMQMGTWNAFSVIKINFWNPQDFQNVRPENSPNVVPPRYQTMSDHQSEAGQSKIEQIEAGDSPGLTLPS